MGTTTVPGGLPDWTKIDITSFLDAGKNLVGFGVWGYESFAPGADITLLDDLQIETVGVGVPEPTAFLLLSLGLAGLGSARRPRNLLH